MRPELNHFLKDNGYKSRKLSLCLLGLVMISGFVVVSLYRPAVQPMFSEFITGILGVLSIYVGGNTVGRWGMAKHVGSKITYGPTGMGYSYDTVETPLGPTGMAMSPGNIGNQIMAVATENDQIDP